MKQASKISFNTKEMPPSLTLLFRVLSSIGLLFMVGGFISFSSTLSLLAVFLIVLGAIFIPLS